MISQSIFEKDVQDKPTYNYDSDMNHHKKAIEELENGSVKKLKTLQEHSTLRGF